MNRIILNLFLQLICCFSVCSQEILDKVLIKNDTIILTQDTLVIGITGLSDILTKSQIDSLGSPCVVDWDGDCDSGTDYEHCITKHNYKTVYTQNSLKRFILSTISIKNTNNIPLCFGDNLIVNRLTHKDIQDLGLKEDHYYTNKDSTKVYRKEGMSLTVYESNDQLKLKSIHIHPKSWDQYLKRIRLNGEVKNFLGEPLPGVVLLAYNKFDSLKYYEITDIDGKYSFEIDSVERIDVSNFNYESQTLKLLENKDQVINFKLKKKTYFLPDLIVTKKGEIENDSTCYFEQFPKIKDYSKINVWLWCEFSDYNPLIYNLPSAIGDLRNTYVTLVSTLNRKKKCEAEIYLTIDKNGITKLVDITCDNKINKEFLARSIVESFKWTPAKWRGRRIDSNWSLKIIFE